MSISVLFSDMLGVAATSKTTDPLTVFLLGVGTVFVCLASIIFIIWIVGKLFNKRTTASTKAIDAHTNEAIASDDTPDTLLDSAERTQVIAAVSAALAEYMGQEVAGIRIRSIKRM